MLFKICEKLENLEEIDNQTIKTWLDRLEKKYPNHQCVFNLKDKLQLENGNYSSRLENTFRDLSNVKLTDLTDDKCANLSCSFLNTRSPSLTTNQFKSLERSQERLFKKIIEIEENFNKTTSQILESVKDNQTMYGQLKNEVDKITSNLDKLQLGQREIKETIEVCLNGDYEDDEEEDDDEDETVDDEETNENNPSNISNSFLSCNSHTNQQNTSDVFSRLGPAKQPSPIKSTNSSFNQQQPISQLPVNNNNSLINQFIPKSPFTTGTTAKQQLPTSTNTGINQPLFTNSPINQQQSNILPVLSALPDKYLSPTTTTTITPNKSLATVNHNKIAANANPNVPLTELFKDQNKNKWECTVCYVKNDLGVQKCISCETPNPAASPAVKDQQTASIGKPFSFVPNLTGSGFSFSQMFNQQQQQQQPSSTNIPTDNKFVFGVPSSTSLNKDASSKFTFNSSQIFGQQQPTATSAVSQLPTLSPLKQSQITPPPLQPFALPSSGFVFGNQNTSTSSFSSLTPAFGTLNTTTTSSNASSNVLSPANKSSSISSASTTTTIVENTNKASSEQQSTAVDVEEEPQIDFKPVIPLPPKVDVITGEEKEEVLFVHRAKLFRYTENEWKERGLGDIKILFDKVNNRYRLIMRRDQIHKVCLNAQIYDNFEFKPVENQSSNMLRWGCIDFSEGKSKPEVFLIKFKAKEIAERFKVEVYKVVRILKGSDNSSSEVPSITTTNDKNKVTSIATASEEELINKFDDLEVVYVKEPKSKEDKEKAAKLKLPANFFNLENVKECAGCNGCKDYIPKLKYELKLEIENRDDKENRKLEDKQDENTENLFSSAIAKAGSTKSSWIKSGEQPKWMKSALTPIFSTVGGSANLNDPEAEIDTLDFKPVIPLPDLIEVKTGEEEEEVLFSNRSKLYKFTNDEWKERGLGEFKVLKHRSTQAIRFLMRREQVYKVCLNHLVDKNLKIGLRHQCDRVFQWTAKDYSESKEGEPSLFSLKFKNKEFGIKFMDTLKKHIDGFQATIYN